MRNYAANSPEAISRLIALAMLADGGLDRSEIKALQRSHILAQLGIRELLFQRITHELCQDLQQCVSSNGSVQITLDENIMDLLFADVTAPAARIAVLRAMLDIVDADGQLAPGESALVGRAMALWYRDFARTQVSSLKPEPAIC